MLHQQVVVALLLLSVFACNADDVVHYYGQKVIRAIITNKQQIEFIDHKNLDVWSRHGVVVLDAENDIMLSDSDILWLEALGVSNYTVLIPDVEEHIHNPLAKAERNTQVPHNAASPFFDAYHQYADIVNFMKNLTTTYSSLATFVPSIGDSVESRAIPAVEITGGKGTAKKSLMISAGQHAREWIAHATALYILESLLTKYGVDAATTSLVDKFNIYVVPLVNPDGYAYTTTSRLWRKNRRHNSGGSFGVDLNRNWDEHWCEYGASKTQTSDTYCGTAPFSEPETMATKNYILKHVHTAYIDFHSYGQLVLRPYGWTVSPPPTETLLKSVGDGIAAAIRTNSGKVYTSEHGADLYPASGAADDWGFTVAKIPLVYTIELRDTGTYGFQLPANQIVGTGEEAYAAFMYLSTRS